MRSEKKYDCRDFQKNMKPLKELSRIDFGCYDSALSKGEILYLQLKNFDENNQFLANVDAFVEEDEKIFFWRMIFYYHLKVPEFLLLCFERNGVKLWHPLFFMY